MKKLITLSLIVMTASTVMAFHGADSRCNACHLVHMATDNTGVPLWNGAQTITYSTFTDYYEGYKMDGTVSGDPAGSTLLCLSCHDGGTSHAMAPAQGDMSGTHPIEFVYDSALVGLDNELKNPESTLSGIVGSSKFIADDMLTPGDQVLNCVSCHEIHAQALSGQTTLVDDGTGTGTTIPLTFDIPHLVNIPGIEWQYNSRSGLPRTDTNAYRLIYTPLCNTCHIK